MGMEFAFGKSCVENQVTLGVALSFGDRVFSTMVSVEGLKKNVSFPLVEDLSLEIVLHVGSLCSVCFHASNRGVMVIMDILMRSSSDKFIHH